MPTIVLTRLADLRAGDVILSLDGRRYRTPLRVTDALGPIAPGSPVHGVRLEPPNPASGIDPQKKWMKLTPRRNFGSSSQKAIDPATLIKLSLVT